MSKVGVSHLWKRAAQYSPNNVLFFSRPSLCVRGDSGRELEYLVLLFSVVTVVSIESVMCSRFRFWPLGTPSELSVGFVEGVCVMSFFPQLLLP